MRSRYFRLLPPLDRPLPVLVLTSLYILFLSSLRPRLFPPSSPSYTGRYSPSLAESASVDAEIARFRAIDAQKEKEHKKKMKGRFLWSLHLFLNSRL